MSRVRFLAMDATSAFGCLWLGLFVFDQPSVCSCVCVFHCVCVSLCVCFVGSAMARDVFAQFILVATPCFFVFFSCFFVLLSFRSRSPVRSRLLSSWWLLRFPFAFRFFQIFFCATFLFSSPLLWETSQSDDVRYVFLFCFSVQGANGSCRK